MRLLEGFMGEIKCIPAKAIYQLTDRGEVFIIDSCHILVGKERRTIMIARNLGMNYLTADNRERIVLLAAYR